MAILRYGSSGNYFEHPDVELHMRSAHSPQPTDRSSLRAAFVAIVVVFALVAAACGDSSAGDPDKPTSTTAAQATTIPGSAATTAAPGGTPGTTIAPAAGFATDVVATIDSVEHYFDGARVGPTGTSTLKFVLPEFPTTDDVLWLDSQFYELHDEWYWFQLLNGTQPPGSQATPLLGQSFDTVAQAKAWARENVDELPDEVSVITSRLRVDRVYSADFYELANGTEPRQYGVGSVVFFPANELTGDRWLLELGFGDDVAIGELETFFDRLTNRLPDDIATNLEWVIRSPEQEVTARAIEADGHWLASRIVRYDDLVPAGETAVYNEGIAAGRLLLVEDGAGRLEDARDTDILLVDNVPDYLPPANALISSAPQTPLAHVNLLARNRGIPNASLSGLFNNDEIRQAARVRSYAIVRAEQTTTGDQLDIVLITSEQYAQWVGKQSKEQIDVDPPNNDISTVVDLTELAQRATTRDQLDQWVPTIGGKAVGFLTLLQTNVRTPDRPVAISIAAYQAHLRQSEAALDAILAIPNFDGSDNRRLRYLLFEGRDDYDERFASDADQAFADDFTTEDTSNVVRSVLAADGFQRYFRDQPLDPATLDEITTALAANFDHLDPRQGLRFRSSSSAEDIEGFSGAGLYDSNTGFLDPLLQPDDSDHKKTVEYTVKKTWASYWSFEAYEERRREQIGHRSAGMGIVVHPRFDDELETNNGVMTVTLQPADDAASPSRLISTVDINVQVGAVSVTNPDPTSAALPEVLQVTVDGADSSIQRISESTLRPGGPVLSDQHATALATQATTVAMLWIDLENAQLPEPQRRKTFTLDFEFKSMDTSWPRTIDAKTYDTPLVLKQVRSLNPGLRGIPAEVRDLPIPNDVLERATIVQRRTCQDPDRTTWWELFTDPLAVPRVGFVDKPFLDPSFEGRPDGDYRCPRKILHATADRFLYELLDSQSADDN